MAHVLLVEDDDSVREFTTRMLKTVGYRILSAPDGPKALDLFKANGPQIDLVMSDMVMPNMTGKQFVEAVRQIDKKMKILFVSGYSPDDTTDETAFDKGIAFLQKPYTRDQLSKKIRDVLVGEKT